MDAGTYRLLALATLIFAYLFLVGCTTTQTIPVKIPVAAACPAPTIPPRPHLPIADLHQNSSPADNQKAMAATIRILIGRDLALEKILGSYQHQGK